MGPVEIVFKEKESMATLNSLALGIGLSRGSVMIPFTALDFSYERKKSAFGEQFAIANRHMSNEVFYNNFYSGIPSSDKQKFRNSPRIIERNVVGLLVSLDLLKSAEAINTLIKGELLARTVFQKIVSKIRNAISQALGSIGLDSSQTGISSNGLVYGKNGADTYNMNIDRLASDDINICIIQGAIGAFVGTGLNLVCFGNFPTWQQYLASNKNRTNPYYLDTNYPAQTIFEENLRFVGDLLSRIPIIGQMNALVDFMLYALNKSFAFAFIADASAGLILPNLQFQIISNS